MLLRLLAALCALCLVPGVFLLAWCGIALVSSPGILDARTSLLPVYACMSATLVAIGLGSGWRVRSLVRQAHDAELRRKSEGER